MTNVRLSNGEVTHEDDYESRKSDIIEEIITERYNGNEDAFYAEHEDYRDDLISDRLEERGWLKVEEI